MLGAIKNSPTGARRNLVTVVVLVVRIKLLVLKGPGRLVTVTVMVWIEMRLMPLAGMTGMGTAVHWPPTSFSWKVLANV